MPVTHKTFKELLAAGQAGEHAVANWLRQRGWTVLPASDMVGVTNKGPRVWGPTRQYVAPDMLVFRQHKVFWVELKTKSSFTWHRNSQQWLTGIDLHYYYDYIALLNDTAWPVWLFFLQTNPLGAKDTPAEQRGKAPVGLFGGSLERLMRYEHHRHANYGKHGMVFWAVRSLNKITNIERS